MTIKKILIVVFFVMIRGNAQNLELGKVTIAELQEKVHSKDSSAVAAILFKKGRVYFDYTDGSGFEMKTEVLTKIKVYKKDGYNWANHAVRYYLDGDYKERVSFSDVVTYNLVDGKIEKSKLKSEGVFDEKINRYWGRKKIAMPNVKEGSIIEYRYVINSPSIGSFRDWDFQTSIPVNYSEFKTYVPEYFVYNANQKGFIFPKKTVDKNTKTITLNSKERNNNGSTNFSSDNISYTETKTTYIADNLPAIKEEAFVNNIDNYTTSVAHELSVIQYPNSIPKYFATNWETLTKKIYEYDDFGPELKKTGYFEDDVNAIIAGLKTRDEKIEAIFNFVKSKVKWNQSYGYTCDDGVKAAYKNKVGNVAEINLMLTAMLRYAQIEANPVLISTRSNGIALFPNRGAYDYVIAAVELENDLILLDATEKYAAQNILPLRDLNWFGRLIRKDGTSAQVELSPKKQSKDFTMMAYTPNSDGTIVGQLRHQLTDYNALSFRQKNIDLTQDVYLEQLENKHNNIDVSDYKRDNEQDITKPIQETYAFKDTKSMEIIGDKMYITPLLFLNVSENPFKQEKREYPVEFGFSMQDKFTIVVDIPEGYVVDSMPAAINLAAAGEMGTFKYFTGVVGNKIQIQITTDINVPIVPADYYDVLKEFFKKMIEKQNEKIVLKKA
jgi:hypothetical protein